jgi:hypothetical protein
MDQSLKYILWNQFGAAINMLENAINACPAELWNNELTYWYWSYHTIFYLDYYSDPNPTSFLPPSPFTLSEFEGEGSYPEQVYTKIELLTYLDFCRKKCHDLIMGFTTVTAAHRFINVAKNYSMTELVIYNLRHVQHHTAQLNLLLRQAGVTPPSWISDVGH